jgi:hypothetical protein
LFKRKSLQDDPNSITFALPDGTKGRAWLASDDQGSKIIGDDRLWRVNTEELLRQNERLPKAVSLIAVSGPAPFRGHHHLWPQSLRNYAQTSA